VNLGVCCKFISHVIQPGETMNFNNEVSPFNAANGYRQAPLLKDGETKMGYGGGSCQISSTLYNVILQLPGLNVLERHPHGASGAAYLPHGVDASSGDLNFRFSNGYDFPIRIEASCHDLCLFIAIYREDGR
jgi:vancomycin resistance protein YoaR